MWEFLAYYAESRIENSVVLNMFRKVSILKKDKEVSVKGSTRQGDSLFFGSC